MCAKQVMTALAPTGAQTSAVKPRKKSSATESTHRETSKTAVLLEPGPAGLDRLEVDYSGAWPKFTLNAAGITIFEGEWRGSLEIDGKAVPLTGQWDWCCWHGDEDGSYLELELPLGPHLKLERQFFLSRGQHRLLLGETVVSGKDARSIRVVSELPLAAKVTASPDRPTRELKLKARGRPARFVPLDLPQDRVESTRGAATTADGTVRLERHGTGRGLYSAGVIDWQPERTRAPVDWRTLTVSEDGVQLGRDMAAGFRIRLGDEQWLVYRQIHRSAVARCLLGYHTYYESVVGRVLPKGEIKTLLQIQ